MFSSHHGSSYSMFPSKHIQLHQILNALWKQKSSIKCHKYRQKVYTVCLTGFSFDREKVVFQPQSPRTVRSTAVTKPQVASAVV